MLAFLGLILPGVFSTIGTIEKSLADAKVALANAQTDKDRIAAQERINTLQAQQAVLIADAGKSKLDIFVRVGFALPFILYNAKIIVYDKMLSLGVTDPLSSQLVSVELAIIGFYFLHSAWTSR